jgi:NADH dehydrogenase FAD-containing subunit
VHAEPTLAVPGHREIFVAGDICALSQDGVPLPGVAQVAKQEGGHAARNVVRAIRGEPLEPFRYRDYGNMATIGRGSAVADIGPIKASGLIAWLIWVFIHIFWLIGFRNRDRRAQRVGVVVPHVPAPRAIDYGAVEVRLKGLHHSECPPNGGNDAADTTIRTAICTGTDGWM